MLDSEKVGVCLSADIFVGAINSVFVCVCVCVWGGVRYVFKQQDRSWGYK